MKNIILIGMPGVGKSTLGVILAKQVSKDFVDTDLLIQKRCRTSLQEIINKHGYMRLREIEEEVILSLKTQNAVIATGGSAVYSEKAMRHLNKNGTIVFLQLQKDELLKRIPDMDERGIAKPHDQSFSSLYAERQKLYARFGEITITCKNKTHEEIVSEIIAKLKS